MDYTNEFKEFKRRIESATNIVIFSHRNPDPDSLGANFAVAHALKKLGKNVITKCINEPNPKFDFLLVGNNLTYDLESIDQVDLFISVDLGHHTQLGFHEQYPELADKSLNLINIDHHVSNDFFGQVNIVNTKASSTCEIIYFLFKFMDWEFNRTIATYLLAGLYYDTGSYKHLSTTPNSLTISAEMMKYDADFNSIVRHLYKTHSIPKLKLWGTALSNAYINEEGVLKSGINQNDYIKTQSTPEDTSGVIDYLNMVPNQKYTMFISEDGKGKVKGSLRSKDMTIDVSKIAATFGGGGHRVASGFGVKGDIKKRQEIIINQSDNK